METLEALKDSKKTVVKTTRLNPSTTDTEELLLMPIDEFFSRLNTSTSGLTSQEAES